MTARTEPRTRAWLAPAEDDCARRGGYAKTRIKHSQVREREKKKWQKKNNPGEKQKEGEHTQNAESDNAKRNRSVARACGDADHERCGGAAPSMQPHSQPMRRGDVWDLAERVQEARARRARTAGGRAEEEDGGGALEQGEGGEGDERGREE